MTHIDYNKIIIDHLPFPSQAQTPSADNVDIQSLKEDQKHYQRLISDLGDKFVIYSHKLTGELTYVSDGVKMLFGLSKKELLAKRWSDAIDWDLEDIILANDSVMRLALGEEGPAQIHMSYRHLDGTHRTIKLTSHAVRDESGNISEIAGIVEDVTSQRKDESERETLLHDLDGRVKELQCMYDITKAIRSFTDIRTLLQHTVIIMPNGWHHPENTNARIVLDDVEYIDSALDKDATRMRSEIIIDDVQRGLIEVSTKIHPDEIAPAAFLEQEHALIDSISAMLSEAIKRHEVVKRLQYMATHDALTGLYSRNTFRQRLEDDLERASRYGHGLSIFMLDIDRFKKINDDQGHHIGDLVLKEFACILEKTVRKTDYVIRYGGDEFIIVLPETSPEQTDLLAQRLLEDISKHQIQIPEGDAIKITSSIGIACRSDRLATYEKLVKAADMAMYASKKAGRDKIRRHRDDTDTTTSPEG